MAQLELNRILKLREPLINSRGERVDKIKLDGSFILNEFRNSKYIYFDRATDSWQLDFELLVTEIVESIDQSGNSNKSAEASIINQSVYDAINDPKATSLDKNILTYDEESSSFVLRDIDSEISSISLTINEAADNIVQLDTKIEQYKELIPDFFYGSDLPLGSGTDQISEGSIWHSPASEMSDTINYAYIFDGENYYWVEI